eukprot:Awhi_evm1s10179
MTPNVPEASFYHIYPFGTSKTSSDCLKWNDQIIISSSTFSTNYVDEEGNLYGKNVHKFTSSGDGTNKERLTFTAEGSLVPIYLRNP